MLPDVDKEDQQMAAILGFMPTKALHMARMSMYAVRKGTRCKPS
jgi:hypothetical protein